MKERNPDVRECILVLYEQCSNLPTSAETMPDVPTEFNDSVNVCGQDLWLGYWHRLMD